MASIIRKISAIKSEVVEKLERKLNDSRSQTEDDHDYHSTSTTLPETYESRRRIDNSKNRESALSYLGDDTDEFTSDARLTMVEDNRERISSGSFGEGSHRYPFSQFTNTRMDRLSFEVVSVEKLHEARTSFMVYKISVDRTGCHGRHSAVLSKRFSDFEQLHAKLCKQYPIEMQDVKLPRKKLTGNFSDETVARRSHAFEQYLMHICSDYTLRFSTILEDFLYLNVLYDGFLKFHEQNYQRAIDLLEQSLSVQEHVTSNAFDRRVVCVLCALVVCYVNNKNPRVALKYGDIAMRYVDENESVYVIPLLQTLISLCWQLGKDKQDLEARLRNLVGEGECEVSLSELLLKEFTDNLS